MLRKQRFLEKEERGQNSTVGSERSDNIGKDEIMFQKQNVLLNIMERKYEIFHAL